MASGVGQAVYTLPILFEGLLFRAHARLEEFEVMVPAALQHRGQIAVIPNPEWSLGPLRYIRSSNYN